MFKKILKWCFFGFVGLIALGLFLESQQTPEQKAANAAAIAERNAAEAAQQQEQAKQEMAALPVVQASAIARAYRDNTVAADQQYKGKKLRITGAIAEISTDFGGDPVVTLRGGVNPFMEPRADFDDGFAAQIAKLKKGAKIEIICTGGGDIAKTPMLHECVMP